jgi:hypothetical protein
MAEIRREREENAGKNKKIPEALQSVCFVASCHHQMTYIGMPD